MVLWFVWETYLCKVVCVLHDGWCEIYSRLPPCLPASLPPCLPASLLAPCLLACFHACVLASQVLPWLLGCLLAGLLCWLAGLLACLLASCRSTFEDRFLKKKGESKKKTGKVRSQISWGSHASNGVSMTSWSLPGKMESVFRLTPGWAMHKNHDHMPPNLWPFVIICIWFKTCIDWYWMCDKFREKMWEAPIQNWPQQARMCYSWVTGTQEHLGSLWSDCQGQEKSPLHSVPVPATVLLNLLDTHSW